jgi:hypothetical protein
MRRENASVSTSSPCSSASSTVISIGKPNVSWYRNAASPGNRFSFDVRTRSISLSNSVMPCRSVAPKCSSSLAATCRTNAFRSMSSGYASPNPSTVTSMSGSITVDSTPSLRACITILRSSRRST